MHIPKEYWMVVCPEIQFVSIKRALKKRPEGLLLRLCENLAKERIAGIFWGRKGQGFSRSGKLISQQKSGNDFRLLFLLAFRESPLMLHPISLSSIVHFRTLSIPIENHYFIQGHYDGPKKLHIAKAQLKNVLHYNEWWKKRSTYHFSKGPLFCSTKEGQ